jgi:hypothetical protein
VLLVVPRHGHVEGDVGIGDDADVMRDRPEIEVEDAWELVLLGHCCDGGLDVAVSWEQGECLAHEFEVAPEEGVGRFGLDLSVSFVP